MRIELQLALFCAVSLLAGSYYLIRKKNAALKQKAVQFAEYDRITQYAEMPPPEIQARLKLAR